MVPIPLASAPPLQSTGRLKALFPKAYGYPEADVHTSFIESTRGRLMGVSLPRARIRRRLTSAHRASNRASGFHGLVNLAGMWDQHRHTRFIVGVVLTQNLDQITFLVLYGDQDVGTHANGE